MVYGGGTIGDILQDWANFGVFRYVLPFLMIFAVVFGILSHTKLLGDNKGVQATIALAVGLLSLQFGYVSEFFATIFPYTGMGISVLLVAFILMGLIGSDGGKHWIWFGIGAVIFIGVILSSLSDFAWWGGGTGRYLYDWPAILAVLVVLGLIGFIIFGAGRNRT